MNPQLSRKEEEKCINCRYYFDEEGHQGCCLGDCGNHKCIYNKSEEECLKEFRK